MVPNDTILEKIIDTHVTTEHQVSVCIAKTDNQNQSGKNNPNMNLSIFTISGRWCLKQCIHPSAGVLEK